MRKLLLRVIFVALMAIAIAEPGRSLIPFKSITLPTPSLSDSPPQAIEYAQSDPSNFLDDYAALIASQNSEGNSYLWDVEAGVPITYSFVTHENSATYPDETPEKISPVPEETKTYVRDILNNIYSSVIPVKFQEIKDSNDEANIAQIRVMIYEAEPGTYGSAYYPKQFGDSRDGDVYLYSNGGDWTKGVGSAEYASIVHELGHAMGLKHPGRYSEDEDEPFLPLELDNTINTVMSYNVDENLAEEPSSWNWSLMAYDIGALQSLYGANNDFNSGDTVYKFKSDGTTTYPFNSNNKQFFATQAIWDSGGEDTIDVSALEPDPNGYYFDLREGGQLTTQSAFNAGQYYLYAPDTQNPNGDRDQDFPFSKFATVIGYGVEIEHLKGSSSNDRVLGNKAANRIQGGGGNDILDGGAGNDILEGDSGDDVAIASEGADLLRGGLGNDTYWISPSLAAGTQIDDTEGIDTVAFIGENFAEDWARGAIAIAKQGRDAIVDLNRDGVANSADDLLIANFFAGKGRPGSGFIESLGNRAGRDLLAHFTLDQRHLRTFKLTAMF